MARREGWPYIREANDVGVEGGAALGVERVEAHVKVGWLLLGGVFLRLLAQRIGLVLACPLLPLQLLEQKQSKRLVLRL